MQMTVVNSYGIRINQDIRENDHVTRVLKPDFAHVHNRKTGHRKLSSGAAAVRQLYMADLRKDVIVDVKNLSFIEPYFLKTNDIGVILPKKIKDMVGIFLIREITVSHKIPHVVAGHPDSFFGSCFARKLQIVVDVVKSCKYRQK